MSRAWRPTWLSPISPSISARGVRGGHRVDHHDVERVRADEHVGDLEGLLPRVGLGDQQLVDVDADLLRTPGPWRARRRCRRRCRRCAGPRPPRHGQRGLAGGLGAVHLDDPASGQAADAEGEVEGRGPRRGGLHVHGALLAHLHHGACPGTASRSGSSPCRVPCLAPQGAPLLCVRPPAALCGAGVPANRPTQDRNGSGVRTHRRGGRTTV